ncbi:MAG: adenylate kinase [Bdellovibrionales bacterium]
MNILLFGPPGAGKGTQSTLLVQRLGMKHISTGDLFRRAIKEHTPLGVEAQKYLDQGKLVPDEVTIKMVDEVLMSLGEKSFILDGFPRNVSQAIALEALLDKAKKSLEKAVFIEVPIDSLVARLSGRRTCKDCGAVYHVDGKPLKDGKHCDVCRSEKVYQREDDKPEAIKTRLQVYSNSTLPMKDFYKKNKRLVEVDGTGTEEEVFGRVKSALKN